MKTTTISKTILLILALVCTSIMIGSAQTTKQATKKTVAKTLKSSGYAPVNGLKMYYEIHGTGKPIVLLHGSYMSIDLNYGELIPELAKTRKVIALEMQGHGRTADIDRPVSFTALADDVVKLLQYLKIDSADVLGYSLGGTVAFEMAIQHPEMVNKLIVISSVHKFKGWSEAVRNAMSGLSPEFLDATPLKTEYDRLAPDPKHWHSFLAKYIRLDQEDFDLGDEQIKALKVPVLLVMGDNDGVDINYKAALYKLCGGDVFADMAGLPPSQLAIVPGATHVTLMMQTDKLLSFIHPFLNGTTVQMPGH